MNKYVLYAHGGSGNHGCEAIVRSTCKLLNLSKDLSILISKRPEEDIHYGVNSLCKVIPIGATATPSKRSLAFWSAYWQLKIHHNFIPMDMLSEASATGAAKGDIALAIGGDSYCYPGSEDWLAYCNNVCRSIGMKTVFWGCSFEEYLLNNPSVVKDVSRFDLVTARETFSYETLKKVNPNTILVSDPAFLLDKKLLPFPAEIDSKDIVGINLSPLVEKSGSDSLIRKNYMRLIETILCETNYNILLIPHVMWSHDDDRTVLQEIYASTRNHNRVFLVSDCSCEELKGYISRCRFFIGARTHATIAAYSTMVPTLVVGYSIKSRGIACDIFGTDKNYVIPAQEMLTENALTNAFDWIMNNESLVRSKLAAEMPSYINRAYLAADALKQL